METASGVSSHQLVIFIAALYYNHPMNTAHIFTPKDDSLEARAKAYCNVYQAWQNAEASLKFHENDEWRDTLGEREEVQQALDISIHSLDVAAESFSKEDIAKAKAEHLLENSEVVELVRTQRKLEMRAIREEQQQDQDSDESTFSQKQ